MEKVAYYCGRKIKNTHMKIKHILSSILFVWLAASCAEETPYIDIDSSERATVSLGARESSLETFSFSTNQTWTASDDADWLTVSPTSGGAGNNTLTLKVEKENRTGETRTATITLTTATLEQKIQIEQEADRYVKLEQDTIRIGMEGGDIEVRFTTNMGEDEYAVYRTDRWLTQEGRSTRAHTGYVPLTVLPNIDTQRRAAYVVFTASGEQTTDNPFATAVIVQDGLMSSYESTDYSADKTVRVLQEATRGEGIPIVLMGDGFMDTEIADGTYDAVMDQAYANLFSEEPVRSLRDYFDVYAVTAVSRNSGVGTWYDTVFSTWLEGGGSSLIEGDEEAVQEYVECVEDIDMENTLAVVIPNTTDYAGTTYFGYGTTEHVTEFAIAYCPIIDGINAERFRTVLCHEAIGHGFGKLGDEYAYEENGTIPSDEIENAQAMQSLGWMQNVDFTDDENTVLWSAFLFDTRYAKEELGVYEGAYTYIRGAYRPTEESIMNGNTGGFNAPSRQALYNKVMKLGEGREATYEEFVTFDSPETQTKTRAASIAADFRPFHAPQFVNRPLRK